MNSYLIECAEINYFTIEVDAQNEDEARELAHTHATFWKLSTCKILCMILEVLFINPLCLYTLIIEQIVVKMVKKWTLIVLSHLVCCPQ